MRRALTKIVTVLVQSILVICSLGLVCAADKLEDPFVHEITSAPDVSDTQDDKESVDSTDKATSNTSDEADGSGTAAEKVNEDAPKYYFRTIMVDDVNPASKKPDQGSASRVSADFGIYRYQMTGNQKIAYEKIRNCIIDVANGTSACTKFTVTFAELGLGDHHEYTAEELGVVSIIADGTITDEAANAMSQKTVFDMQGIVNKVLVDLPFDCYWFDKTALIMAEDYSVGATVIGDSVTLHYVGDGLTFRFPIVTSYAGSNEYYVSTASVQRALYASGRAKAIVNEYCDLSDYGKLMKYRDVICDLVDYNDQSVVNEDTPYGDPWNIVYVFDGDEKTNVVCEGYSKAFKYLCDLSEFDNDVTCITASGNFFTTNGSDCGHMWNIVYLGYGMNYMVDVTNCDNGSLGYYDSLMFKKYDSNPSSNIYRYKVNDITIQYTYYDYMMDIFRDATLDLSDNAFVDAPAIYLNYSRKVVDLNWNVVSGADHYEIYRRYENGNWTRIGSSINTHFQDNNVSEGKYYYGIVGLTADNEALNVYNDKYSIDCYY